MQNSDREVSFAAMKDHLEVFVGEAVVQSVDVSEVERTDSLMSPQPLSLFEVLVRAYNIQGARPQLSPLDRSVAGAGASAKHTTGGSHRG